MPELPEVETVKRGLEGFIKGAKITKIDIRCPKSFIGEPRMGQITNIRRFGKALIIDLNTKYSLMIHLRMTGQLIFDSKKPPSSQSAPERYAAGHPSENFIADLPNKQTRVILALDRGTLYFNDQRKFGFIKVLHTPEVEQDSFIQKLGKEPWHLSAEELHVKLQRHKSAPIKATILDQTIVAGLGNIYADEALYRAKIHPARKSGSLSQQETEQLLASACLVMEKSIASGGSTMRNYVKADGTRGNYLDLFAEVYHQNGQPCKRCGAIITKTKVAGRSTHFCPECQKINPIEPVENSNTNTSPSPDFSVPICSDSSAPPSSSSKRSKTHA